MNQRTFTYPILDVIQKRWSPRSFKRDAVKEDHLYQILEAARYAPSSSNEQPWRFLVINEHKHLSIMHQSLNDFNLEWAQHAPVMIVLMTHKQTKSLKPNAYARFDLGAAWAFMALEATHLNLVVHAMGGFNAERVRQDFSIEDALDIVALVAVGYQGEASQLNEKNQSREFPSDRKNLEEIIRKLG